MPTTAAPGGANVWTIEFHKNAEKELRSMPREIREKITYSLGKIETEGFFAISSKNYKHVSEDIWELRTNGKDGIARSLYVTKTGQVLKVLLVFIKKTQKTPTEKIELAKQRRDDA